MDKSNPFDPLKSVYSSQDSQQVPTPNKNTSEYTLKPKLKLTT